MPEPGAPPFRRDRLVWTLYLLWGLFSYCLCMIGPAVPYLRDRFHLGYMLAALHMTLFAVGMVGSGLAAPAVLRRAGVVPGTWLGMAGLLAGTMLLVLAPAVGLSLAATLVVGLSGALALTGAQTSISALFPTQRAQALVEGTVVASLFSAAPPFLIALGVLTPLGWRIIGPAFAAGLAAVAILGGPAMGRHGRSDSARLPDAEGPLPRDFWVSWVLMLTGVSCEWCLGFWATEYLKDLPGRSLSVAALGAGVFQVAAVAARLVSSRAARTLPEGRLLVAGMVLVAAGFPSYWLRAGIASAFLGLSLCGAGVAIFYPMTLSLMVASSGGRLRRANASAPVAIGLSVGLGPLLLGRLADLLGLRAAMLSVPATLAAMALLLALRHGSRSLRGLAPQTHG